MSKTVFVAAAFGLWICTSATNAQVLKGIPEVMDGDTFILNGKRISLYGIDAPELEQTCSVFIFSMIKIREVECGKKAAESLKLEMKSLSICELRGRDRDGRTLAVCFNNHGTSINSLMVGTGMAVSERTPIFGRREEEYPPDYSEWEKFARELGVGIWEYHFTRPKDWRRRRRTR